MSSSGACSEIVLLILFQCFLFSSSTACFFPPPLDYFICTLYFIISIFFLSFIYFLFLFLQLFLPVCPCHPISRAVGPGSDSLSQRI